VYDSGFRV